jgi:hypothetical protein
MSKQAVHTKYDAESSDGANNNDNDNDSEVETDSGSADWTDDTSSASSSGDDDDDDECSNSVWRERGVTGDVRIQGRLQPCGLRNTVVMFVPVIVAYAKKTCMLFRFDADDVGEVMVPVPGTGSVLLRNFNDTKTMREVVADAFGILPTTYVDPAAESRTMATSLEHLLHVYEPICAVVPACADSDNCASAVDHVRVIVPGMIRNGGFAVIYNERQWDAKVAETTVVFTDGTLALPPVAALGPFAAYTAYDGGRPLDGTLQKYMPRTMHPAAHVTIEPDAVSSVFAVTARRMSEVMQECL